MTSTVVAAAAGGVEQVRRIPRERTLVVHKADCGPGPTVVLAAVQVPHPYQGRAER